MARSPPFPGREWFICPQERKKGGNVDGEGEKGEIEEKRKGEETNPKTDSPLFSNSNHRMGMYYQSFQRHVDRVPMTLTICCDCGRLSTPVAIRGQLPICAACHKKGPPKQKQAHCAVCNFRLQPRSFQATVLVKSRWAFCRAVQTEVLCYRCVALGDPARQPWDLSEIRRLRQQERLSF